MWGYLQEHRQLTSGCTTVEKQLPHLQKPLTLPELRARPHESSLFHVGMLSDLISAFNHFCCELINSIALLYIQKTALHNTLSHPLALTFLLHPLSLCFLSLSKGHLLLHLQKPLTLPEQGLRPPESSLLHDGILS